MCYSLSNTNHLLYCLRCVVHQDFHKNKKSPVPCCFYNLTAKWDFVFEIELLKRRMQIDFPCISRYG